MLERHDAKSQDHCNAGLRTKAARAIHACQKYGAACSATSGEEHAPDPITCLTEKHTNHAHIEMWDRERRITRHKPASAVLQRCATPFRPPSAASATTASLSTAGLRAPRVLPMPWAAIFSFYGEEFLCGTNQFAGLRPMMLWCMDVALSAWMCVGVKCANICRFVLCFQMEAVCVKGP